MARRRATTTDVIHYAAIFEVGGGIRILSFAGANDVAGSPVLSWDPGARWRLDGRYPYSRSSFHATGESSGDQSVFMRGTWRGCSASSPLYSQSF